MQAPAYVHSLDDDFLRRMFAKHKSKLAFKTAIAADYKGYALTSVIEVGPLDGPSRWPVPPRSGSNYTPKEGAARTDRRRREPVANLKT